MLAATDDEPREAGARSAPLRDAPAAGHAQVAPEHLAALEREEQVLAEGLDALEPPSVEALGDALAGRARVGRLDLDVLSDEDLQALGGAVEGITFGHRYVLTVGDGRVGENR